MYNKSFNNQLIEAFVYKMHEIYYNHHNLNLDITDSTQSHPYPKSDNINNIIIFISLHILT
jgi:hypothetical protein